MTESIQRVIIPAGMKFTVSTRNDQMTIEYSWNERKEDDSKKTLIEVLGIPEYFKKDDLVNLIEEHVGVINSITLMGKRCYHVDCFTHDDANNIYAFLNEYQVGECTVFVRFV